MPVTDLSLPHWLVLAGLLLGSAQQDVAHRRIPNALLLCAGVAGLGLALQPAGTGVAAALGGALLAAGVFLPLYVFGQLGGGDLKLIATTGLLVGLPRAIALCLAVALAGGLLALGWRMRQALPAAGAGTQRMPYALAVALGGLGHGLLLPLTTLS